MQGSQSFRQSFGPVLAGLSAAALVAGCATAYPKPTQQLESTQAAIAAASGANARDTAPVLLNSAQNKLLEAQEAIDAEAYRKATWLLQEAEAEAELARAKAQTAATRQAVQELEKSIEDLRRRIENAPA